MAGLLGDGWNDPQSAAIMALAGNMVKGGFNGGFGGGLLAAQEAYTGSQDNALKRQFTQTQMADMQQQQQLRALQLQQQQQEWQLQQPLLQAAVSRLRGQQAPGTAAQSGTPAIPASPGGGLGSGTFGMQTGGQPATAQGATQSQQSGMGAGGGTMLPGVPDDVAMWNIGAGGIKSIPTLLNEYNKPTDFQKLLTAAGIDPQSAIGRSMIQGNLAKQNYIAPVNARPGSILRDPVTNMPIAFNPHVPDGVTPSFDASGNVVSMRPIPGAYAAMSNAQTATELGKGEAIPTVAYDASGKPVFSTKATDVRRAGGGSLPGMPAAPMPAPQPGVSGDFRGDPSAAALTISQISDPQQRANAQAAFDAQMKSTNGQLPGFTPEQRPGVVQGAQLSQEELSKKGAALMSDNGNTNTVISRLQNIKMLAPGAIAGAESSRRDFFNGLLSLAGIKGAEDAKTASDLVDKNSSQIVSALRMGQGGGGTDALQTLLGAANPNRHMTKEAISEAADQLIASQKMIQAKAQMLQPHYLSRDPVQYGQKEITFDQNADPRIWQLESMNPQQQSAYVRSLPAEVAADMLQKRKALKSIGALK